MRIISSRCHVDSQHIYPYVDFSSYFKHARKQKIAAAKQEAFNKKLRDAAPAKQITVKYTGRTQKVNINVERTQLTCNKDHACVFTYNTFDPCSHFPSSLPSISVELVQGWMWDNPASEKAGDPRAVCTIIGETRRGSPATTR